MVLVQSGSFWQALNPGYVWETMRAVGWPYALLCFFLFLLNTGAQIAIVHAAAGDERLVRAAGRQLRR